MGLLGGIYRLDADLDVFDTCVRNFLYTCTNNACIHTVDHSVCSQITLGNPVLITSAKIQYAYKFSKLCIIDCSYSQANCTNYQLLTELQWTTVRTITNIHTCISVNVHVKTLQILMKNLQQTHAVWKRLNHYHYYDLNRTSFHWQWKTRNTGTPTSITMTHPFLCYWHHLASTIEWSTVGMHAL